MAWTPGNCLPPSHVCLHANSQCQLLVSVPDTYTRGGPHTKYRFRVFLLQQFLHCCVSFCCSRYVYTRQFLWLNYSGFQRAYHNTFRSFPIRDIGLGTGAFLTESPYQYFANVKITKLIIVKSCYPPVASFSLGPNNIITILKHSPYTLDLRARERYHT
jgi:hypothetical protein